jgi:hypothetical protein
MLRNTENSVIPYSYTFFCAQSQIACVPFALSKRNQNALCARFTVRPVAGLKAKRAELAFQAQIGIPFYAFFT